MTIGGRSLPATPAVRLAASRPRALAAAFPAICLCAPFTFNTTPSPAHGFFSEAFDVPVCADDIHMSVTADQSWDPTDGGSGGPFPEFTKMRLELWTKPVGVVFPNATSVVYRFETQQDSASTVVFTISADPFGANWSHTLSGQTVPQAGDTFELFISHLKESGTAIDVAAKRNGTTILSDSRVPSHDQFYQPDSAPGMTVVMFAGAAQAGGASVTYSSWLAEGSC